MKKTLKNSLLLVMAMLVTIQVTMAKDNAPIKEGKEGIQFFKGTWQEALAKAKKTNKLLFVDAFATWCGPCKMMDKKVFVKKEVGEYFNKNFIPVKINVESTNGRPIATKYQVSAMPTYLFVDGNGKLVYRKLGYMKPDQFIAVGKNAMQIPALRNKFTQGDRSKKFLTEYLSAVENVDTKVVKNYFKQLTEKELLYDKKVFKIMEMYTRDTQSREFKFYLTHIQDYKDEYGKQAISPAVGILDNLYSGAFKQKDKNKLQQLFGILKKLKPVMPNAESIIADIQKKFDKL